MSRSLLACALLLALALPASAQASCQRRGERVLARSAQALVLRTALHHGSGRMLGCRRADGRRVALMALFGSAKGVTRTIRPLRVVGTVVSWGWVDAEPAGVDAVGVGTRDLRDGSGRQLTLDGETAAPLAVAGAPGGALAWISPAALFVAAGREPVRLDRGAAGDLTDLAVDGGDVTWTHAGTARRASLAPSWPGCASPTDVFSITSTPDAVLAFRNSGIGETFRVEAVACLRSGAAGFVAIGQQPARVAGGVAAAAQDVTDTARTIVAVDLATGARIGVPVVVGARDAWDLAADGTIVVAAEALVAHTPDGGAVTLASSPARGTLVVDDATRTVTWGGRRVALP